MADDSIWSALRNLWQTIRRRVPRLSPGTRLAGEVGISAVVSLGIGLATTLFPNRTLDTLRSAFDFGITAVTSNLLIVSLLLLVLYNQYRMRQSTEERRPRAETDGGASSGDPVAFFVGATIGALLGSQYLEGPLFVMGILLGGFALYEYERWRS